MPRFEEVFGKCARFGRPAQLRAEGLYPYGRAFDCHEGPVARYQNHPVLNLGSNNYQGLTSDPRVVRAAHQAIEQYGTSCSGSRLLNGTTRLHRELEIELADFFGKEEALVFSTGFGVNLGVIACLVSKGESVFTDVENHASLQAGCRLAAGESFRFAHNDPCSLERRLRRAGGPSLVVVDGVFSMTGELAPLAEIIPICQSNGAASMVDEAHGVGVFGRGRGACAHLGVLDAVPLVMLTFSKSLASVGGAIVGPREVIEYVAHHAPSYVFTAALPASATAAALAALRIIRDEPERVERLFANAKRFREGLRAIGFVTNEFGPICSTEIGGEIETFTAWRACWDRGVYLNAVVPPAVPQGHSLLRASVMVTHTDDQIDRALDVMAMLKQQLLPAA